MAGSGGDQIIPDCGRMHTLSVKKGCWPSLSAFLGCRPCTSMGTLLLFASARSARRYPASGLPTTLGSSSWCTAYCQFRHKLRRITHSSNIATRFQNFTVYTSQCM